MMSSSDADIITDAERLLLILDGYPESRDWVTLPRRAWEAVVGELRATRKYEAEAARRIRTAKAGKARQDAANRRAAEAAVTLDGGANACDVADRLGYRSADEMCSDVIRWRKEVSGECRVDALALAACWREVVRG